MKNDNNKEGDNKPSLSTIENFVFNQIDKPANFARIKIVNVYDNRYRINIWTTMEEFGFTKQKITKSYFAKFTGNNLILN